MSRYRRSTIKGMVKRWLSESLERFLGRRNLVRLARHLLDAARLDTPNDPRANGEYALQRFTIERSDPAETLFVLDVGANVGEWTESMLSLCHRAGRSVQVFAFEPSAPTVEHLLRRLQAHPLF